MTLDGLLFQALNGLAQASSLFMVAAGLSLVFGVTRIVNLAHGSFFMLGLYLAWTVATTVGGALGFWGALLVAPLIVAGLGVVIEVAILRRLYRAPELFQLLSTFAVLLVLNDAALYLWGPEDLLGPRAAGLEGAVTLLGRRFPTYDLFLIAIGPAVLLALHVLVSRSRFGRLIRAATEDREMVGALGVNQALLFTAVFALAAGLAGLGGALQLPRQPATLTLDLDIIADAFVVTVVGGMGSIPGAFLAAILIAEIKALCIGIGQISVFGLDLNLSKFTLVAEFVVMAVVLVIRPYGLLGRAPPPVRSSAPPEAPLRVQGWRFRGAALVLILVLALLPLAAADRPYSLVIATDILIAVLFAASLHFIMGPAGLDSFGHAAYFGLGAYGAALAVTKLGLPMGPAFVVAPLAAAAGAALFGWFCVRLSGVYLAMLTLAFAQIVWSILHQWEAVTGGSNGIFGVWPPAPFDSRGGLYLLALAVTVAGVFAIRTITYAPFGYAMRAGRDSPLRSEAIGIGVLRVHWLAFVIAGALAGLAGALFAFSKGSVSPEIASIAKSVDGLAMVLLGGVHSLGGPIVGATVFTWLSDTVSRATDYWRALLGGIILLIVLVMPGGIMGTVTRAVRTLRRRAA
ncbi:ABC transporter permease [Amorphus orientalis]|uniref:Branched-chain amino acid transport system permease protein n=1 Tax=Amorphus orientalis TaxID=649198 RepID=A0AAE3VPZ0_9HYPH|nr:ABC transporter permease [Amorphus orientalis]MDQ0316010.1 branched-chain amino acid transport system permease protein [Amorphus orientalis]